MSRFSFSFRDPGVRVLGLVALVLFSIAFVLPSLHVLPEKVAAKWPFQSVVNLGLDLQGGSYLVFHVDTEKVLRQFLQSHVDAVKKDMKEKYPDLRFESTVQTGEKPRLALSGTPESLTKAEALLKKQNPQLQLYRESEGRLLVGLSSLHAEEFYNSILDQSVRVVRNRVDEFGVSEPSISTKGSNRIVVELPGIKDVDQAKDLIGQTAKLEFRLAYEHRFKEGSIEEFVARLEREHGLKFTEEMKLSEYTDKINAFAKGQIPEASEIVFERPEVPGRANGALVPYLLQRAVPVSGGDLQDAHVQFGQYGEPEVAFSLKPDGAKRFGNLTGENVGKRLAIVLDHSVKSAPVINSRIEGQGVITVGRGEDHDKAQKEASNLSIVLRAGALPASLELQEQRVIGPTLGQDSIRFGLVSGTVGCLLIFGFMICYYRLSGIFATVSLLLNLLFSFTILIGMGATLTLPGIAGLALIIGMGVDSNVLIFERIRDEIVEGANPNGAVYHGFSRAFAAILDANVTHGIVGLVLYNFGTGPLKGFAVTLLIGIFTTLFCAVTVCKFMFDYYLKFDPKRISI